MDAWMDEYIKLHSRKLILEYLTHHSSRIENFQLRISTHKIFHCPWTHYTIILILWVCDSQQASNVSEFKIPSHYYSFIYIFPWNFCSMQHHHHHVTLHYTTQIHTHSCKSFLFGYISSHFSHFAKKDIHNSHV